MSRLTENLSAVVNDDIYVQLGPFIDTENNAIDLTAGTLKCQIRKSDGTLLAEFTGAAITGTTTGFITLTKATGDYVAEVGTHNYDIQWTDGSNRRRTIVGGTITFISEVTTDVGDAVVIEEPTASIASAYLVPDQYEGTDVQKVTTAFTNALSSGKGIYFNRTYDLSAIGELATTAINQKITMKGAAGRIAATFGTKSNKFVRLEHNGAEIIFEDFSYTGGQAATADTDLGFHLCWVDNSSCDDVRLFKARNVYGKDSYSFANFEWGGDTGILQEHYIENVRLDNLAWKGFTHSGLQGVGYINGLYINGCKIHGYRGGDETIDLTAAKYTNPADGAYVSTHHHCLNMSNVFVRNVTGASAANGINIQGWKQLHLQNIHAYKCQSTDGSDSEGIYVKALDASGGNWTSIDCRGESNIILKGGSPSGSATPSKGFQLVNLTCITTAEFTADFPADTAINHLKIRSDDVQIHGFVSKGSYQPLNIYGNPGDADSSISVTGIYIDGYKDKAIYVQGTTGWKLKLKGIVKNFAGLLNDTTSYVIDEANCNFRYIDYDITVDGVEGSLGANSYLIKCNQNVGKVARKIVCYGDAIGRILDFNDQVATGVYLENYIHSITNKIWNIRNSAVAPRLVENFMAGAHVAEEAKGSATIADASTSVVVAHGLAATPDHVNAFSADGTELTVTAIGGTNFTVNRTGSSGALVVFWRAIDTVLV